MTITTRKMEGIKMKKKVFFLLTLTLVVWVAGTAKATPITFTGSSGNLAASVTFDVVLGNLVVILTNISTTDILVPSDVLTAVFFTISGNPSLSPISAKLNTGSSVFYDLQGQPVGGVVGGEWAYKNGLSGAPGSANSGISSSGLGLFGPGDRFPGPDLEAPPSPDGVQYGLLSAGDNTTTGNGGITGSGGLIKNSVVFTFSPAGFDLSNLSIADVSFQYGTGLDEPNVRVPEPTTLLLLGAGLIGLAVVGRRLFKRG